MEVETVVVIADDGCSEVRVRAVACVGFALACAIAGGAMFVEAGTRGVIYIVAHLLASAAMILAFTAPESDAGRWLMVTGIVCRLALIPVQPYTTHDVTRYMFDGAMALAGFDPYLVTPGDSRLAGLRALWPTAVEHARYPTIYPPIALWAFASCARFGPAFAWLVWKAIVGIASVVTLVVARRIVDNRALALVALSPVLVFEGGVGGHLDVLCVMAVMLALSESAPIMRGAWIGLGILTKLTPVTLLAPLVAYALPSPWRAFRIFFGGISVVCVGYSVANALGYEALGSLVTFFGKWSFGSPWLLVEEPFGISRETVLRVGVAVAAFAVLWSCRLAWRRALGPALLLAACAPFLASPIVFPWYLCTVAAVLGVAPSWPVVAWLTALPLTYEVIDRFDVDGSWVPTRWPIVATMVVVAVAMPYARRVQS